MNLARRVLPDQKRRGWCPSLARPMPTGDGLLARVHPPLGVLSLVQAQAVAEGARRFGNGHVDVTARGNLQVRGVRDETGAGLAAWLSEAGLGDLRDDGGPQRLTLTSPLAGLEPDAAVDVPALARVIEAEGRDIAGLPAKTLVAVAGARLSGEGADLVVRLTNGGCAVALAGELGSVVIVPEAEVAEAVIAMLRAFASTGRRRVHDLSADERADVRRAGGRFHSSVIASEANQPSLDRRVPRVPGLLRFAINDTERDGVPVAGMASRGTLMILTVEAPFGRCTADALDHLAAVADDVAAPDIRTTPARGFLLACGDCEAAGRALESLTAAGFITRPDDPRRAVAACPGAPACASGTTPVPGHAATLADAFAPFATRGLKAHVSGCAKGCAHPAPADLTLVAEHGRYRLVLGGAPPDEPAMRLTFEAALERVRRADPAAPLAHAFRP